MCSLPFFLGGQGQKNIGHSLAPKFSYFTREFTIPHLNVHDDEGGGAVELCDDADDPDGIGEGRGAGEDGVEGEAEAVEQEEAAVGPAAAEPLLRKVKLLRLRIK